MGGKWRPGLDFHSTSMKTFRLPFEVVVEFINALKITVTIKVSFDPFLTLFLSSDEKTSFAPRPEKQIQNQRSSFIPLELSLIYMYLI